MNHACVLIDGESHLTLEAISECYDCETTWVREVYEFGLLGAGREYTGRVFLRVTVLDRVAEIVRLARYQGLGFEAIALVIGEFRTETWVDVEVEQQLA